LKKVLVTGGAGFIGSHLVDALIHQGYDVRVLDNLEPQVHGDLAHQKRWPAYYNPAAEYLLGDVRNQEILEQAISDVNVVYHFAGATGVGQSMYQIARYTAVNVQGTANLLETLAKRKIKLEKLILASSRAVYGEGLYHCAVCGQVTPGVRSAVQLEQKDWEITCPNCNAVLQPVLTPETKSLSPGSIYAISKQAQEQLSLCFGDAYQVPVVVLRFFNVYGPRQSLNNPYTGILSTFMQRLLNHQPPEIYEDGKMTRDFVYVSDVVRACILALGVAQTATLNIGSGQFTTILEIAQMLSKIVAPDISPQVVGFARVGDIRHCSADLTKAARVLGYRPQVGLQEGLAKIVAEVQDQWVSDQSAFARDELRSAGMLK
jgi:dTDP-L-rhamnose 4-epimerase